MMRTVWVGITVLLAATGAWAKPQVVKAVFPTRDVVIAEEVLTPPAVDGANAAPAVQAAIDRVAKAGGGTVFLSAGAYTIASRIIVREGVTLRGDYAVHTPGRGTLLRLMADKGREDAPATFSLERGGLFETLFDDLKIAPELSPSAWRVHAEPRGGRVPMKTAVRIVHDGSVRVRYTLDGSNPGADSPLAEGPVALPKQKLTELRYSPLKPDGGVSRQVFAALYETE